MRKQTRPVSPLTEQTYKKILARAFGSDEPERFQVPAQGFAEWTDSNKALLRAAISRKVTEQKLSEVDGQSLVDLAPSTWQEKTVVEAPTEEELLRYEAEAKKLPRGKRALVLLPLALGLRSKELLNLSRKSVLRSLETGELKVMRKTGKEQLIPIGEVNQLLQEILEAPRNQRGIEPEKVKPWEYVREIFSTKEFITAYHLFHRLIRDLGEKAGIKGLRPHLLRHGFATRMQRDGAPLALITWVMGHKDVSTTLRYISPDSLEVSKFIRNWNTEP